MPIRPTVPAWPADVTLARAVDRLPRADSLRGGCLYEPKWDGYRGLVATGPTGLGHVRSRRGVDFTRSFPDIASAAARQLPPDTVLDGELVVWTGEGLDFTALQTRVIAPNTAVQVAAVQPATFMAFDALRVAGRDFSTRPLSTRRQALQDLGRRLRPPLQVTPATTDRALAEQWQGDYQAAGVGVEGLVIKALGEPCQPGRRAWLKLRTRTTADAIVGAVTGSLQAPERLILGLLEGDHLVVAGGTGPLKLAQQRELASRLQPPAGEHPWPDVLPAGRTGVFRGERHLPVTLVEPVLVVEVDADAAYEHGRWRHLTHLVRVRLDLTPEDVAPH